MSDVLIYKLPFVAIPEKYMRSPIASGMILEYFVLGLNYITNGSQRFYFKPSRVHLSQGRPATPKVRKHVERQVAQLAAWSIGCSSAGIAPSVGFEGEQFEPGSTRWKMRGKQMACGYKILVLTKSIVAETIEPFLVLFANSPFQELLATECRTPKLGLYMSAKFICVTCFC